MLIHFFSIKVTAVAAYFIEHAFKAAMYLMADQSGLDPQWQGILRSWDRKEGIPRPRAQWLIKWDVHYGYPLLHDCVPGQDLVVVGCFSCDHVHFYLDLAGELVHGR